MGRVIKILVNDYGITLDKKYNKFADAYFSEIIKYRNALGHAMRSNNNDKEIYIGEIEGKAITFNEDLFRKMRASINEYQNVINTVEDAFNDI